MSTPRELPVADLATWWSVPPSEVDAALAGRPLVLLLHGWGADERDLAGLVPALPADYLYASLRAPLPLPGAGYAWFPLALPDLVPDAALADAASRGVLTWLDRTLARVRSEGGAVALLGFSQGAALALQLLRHSPETFAGAALLSGFAVPGLVAGDEAMAQIRPRVLAGHDTADPVIPAHATAALHRFLRGHSDAVVRRYPGAGHGITTEEAADVAEFLRALLDG